MPGSESANSRENPFESCVDAQSKGAKTGVHWLGAPSLLGSPSPPPFTSRVGYCDMEYEAGGWELVAYAPDRNRARHFKVSSDSGTVGDFQGWTTLNAVRTNVNLLITKFRARYVYLEDQVGIPQEGTTFDTYIDFKPSQPSSLSTLTSANMQPDTGSWIAESEGATCNKWYCEC